MKISVLKIDKCKIQEHHLEIIYSVDEFEFATKIFYHDLSLWELIEKYSQSYIEKIVAHIALFEGMKFCSLFPQYYDISSIAKHLESEALDLFVQIYQGVFGQHWYENNITNYQHPEIISYQEMGASDPREILGDNQTILTGCGGGKDSILAMKILEQAGIPFASLQYSHSVYGKADFQHKLISQVVQCVKPIEKHQISIYDNFTESPFLKIYFPENSGIIAPETPVSIFQSLILILDRGYHYLCLAHEKSANTGNLYWEELGKEVNHQWGKGLLAEQILNLFIQEHLLTNFTYFSILQPIYDFRIFQNFSQYPELIPRIHSCNVHKPWCYKCPKCGYVWLGLMAFSPLNMVEKVFKNNLFDDLDLIPIFREMMGLGQHTPFECIGEIQESWLLMRKCLDRGITGRVLDIFKEEILSNSQINWEEIEAKYNRVYEEEHDIPDWIFEKIKEQL